MHDKNIYEYAIIRLVPRVERGEYINIGVILLAKHKNYIGIRYHLDARRISSLYKDVDIDLIRSYLEAWENVCAGGTHGGKIGEMDIRRRFRWLTASRSTIIQSSPVHPGRAENPEEVLNDLFARFVL
jgi:hypothetical protein